MTKTLLNAGGGRLLGLPALLAGKSSRPIRWNPPTLLGLSIVPDSSMLEPVVPEQKALFDAVGLSYVRLCQDYLYYNFWTGSGTCDIAESFISQVQPYPTDPTQIQCRVNGLAYEPKPGEIFVLSAPVTYDLGNGSTFTLPAKTPIPCTGGSAGTFSVGNSEIPNAITYGSVRFAAGQTLPFNGVQTKPNTSLLHRNFYVHGNQIRRPVQSIIARIHEWLDLGFMVDGLGTGPAWEQIERDFGRDAALFIRRQEWAFWASLNLDPDRVLISDGPEPLDFTGAANPKQKWENCRANLEQSYRELRTYFPDHTLALGTPDYGAVNTTQWIEAGQWPGDSNTCLRLHCYPRRLNPLEPVSGSWPMDCYDTDELRQFMTGYMAAMQRAGVPRVYFQEMGIGMSQPDAQLRYGNFRRELNHWGIYQCLWAAQHYNALVPDGYCVAFKQPDQHAGPWVPLTELTGVFFED